MTEPSLTDDLKWLEGKSLGNQDGDAMFDHRTPSRAKELPAVRAQMTATIKRVIESSELGARLMHWEHLAVTNPGLRLIWVSPEMTELLVRVAHTVPDGLTLEDVPRPLYGLAMFAETIVGADAINSERSVHLSGQMWGPISVDDDGTPRTGLSISAVGHAIKSDGVALEGYFPLGRTEWMDDEKIEDLHRAGRMNDRRGGSLDGGEKPDDAAYYNSVVEDRRLVVALFTLMHQERHVETTVWKPQSKGAKKRLGKDTEVTVVQLRRSRPEGSGEVGTGHRWKHRTWVAPYFRMQPYGPGRSLRRLQLVEGHIKGPEGAPMVQRQKVWSLKR